MEPAMFDQAVITPASAEDYPLLAEHYLALWDSYGVPREHHRPDAHDLVAEFLRRGATEFQLGAFICRLDQAAAGSACCQVRQSPAAGGPPQDWLCMEPLCRPR